MTIITTDKQLVHGKTGDQKAERNRRTEKVIESFGGTFRWKPLAVWEMLFTEWHLDYRVALLTITFNTSFFTIALEVEATWLSGKKKNSISPVMWLFEGGSCNILVDIYRQKTGGSLIFWTVFLLFSQHWVTCLDFNSWSSSLSALSQCTSSTFRYTDIQVLPCVVYVNIHWTTLSNCNPQDPPPTCFLSRPSLVLTQTSNSLILEGSHIALVTHFKCISD